MKIERTKNATKNITAGVFMKIYQMLAPFLMRTAMIQLMGVQYLGLNSLFSSVLHILNLAELGVGSAMVFSMYKPIAEDDRSTICALMCLYRRYYRLIGLVIGLVGVAMTPVIPHLVKDGVPDDLNIYILYLLNLGATVLTYWLFAYKNSLLQAHQRTDVSSLVTVLTVTVQYGLQLAVLLLWHNYYIYLMVALATQVMNNVITAIVATKMYPDYKPAGKLPPEKKKDINQRVRDIFTGKMGAVILNSSDSVVISSFLGLSLLAIYQNYYFILTSVLGIVEIALQSIVAGLGNSYITESREKNYADLKKFSFMFLWVICLCSCCFLGLYQPFMELWVGKELMLGFSAVVCFAVYFFVYCINRLLNVYKDAAGLWHKDRFRPLVTALVNLLLNLWWVNIWGIYGVLLSTVLSIVAVGMPWLLRNIFGTVFPKKWLWNYMKQLISMTVLVVAVCAVTYGICHFIQLQLWLTLVLRGIVCITVPNVICFFVLRRTEQFRPAVQMMDRITKNKLGLERKLFR